MDNEAQAVLENICVNVLRRLIQDGAFSSALGIKGFFVLGPDDPKEVVMAKKRLFDALTG